MLPYLAQGANSSLEDGAVLGKLLGHVQNAASIPKALGLYQEVRKVRGETLGREAIKQVCISSSSNHLIFVKTIPSARVLPYARW